MQPTHHDPPSYVNTFFSSKYQHLSNLDLYAKSWMHSAEPRGMSRRSAEQSHTTFAYALHSDAWEP
eukprot:390327-Amorphochlora_amoeboformis.AAC.1